MTHVAWRPNPISGFFIDSSDAIGWQVFNRRASSATLSFGLFPAVSASGAAGDSDQTVLPGLAFQPHLPAPFDVRAGTGVTVTRDAQGFTVAAPGAGTPPDSDQAILSGREFSGDPPLRIPKVQAGTNVTVVENALGPVISAASPSIARTLMLMGA